MAWSDYPCWVHPNPHSTGYGLSGRNYAHRVAWEVLVGPIPEGHHIDHLCRVRACYNPRHLEPVTQAENNRRMHDVFRAENCPQGHNDWARLRSGKRRCAECHRLRERARYARLS